MGESPIDFDDLDIGRLGKLLVSALHEIETLREENVQLREQINRLQEENEALREEILRLKGLKGRPKLKPSGMEQETTKRVAGKIGKKRRRRGGKITGLKIDAEQVLKVTAPEGSRFKGYEDRVVQDLEFRPHTVRYRRQRWITPDGKILIAPLPDGIKGGFGPGLRCYVLAHYHQGQMTIPRLCDLLNDIGLAISQRQIRRLLNDGHDGFHDEAMAVLRTGLETANWVSVDDTGARHNNRNGYCTQIGNDLFTFFATTFSKSRRNFLKILCAGHGDYIINDAALAYMRRANLSGPVIAMLKAHPCQRFDDEAAWMVHLESLDITGRNVHPNPVKIASQGALYGSMTEHGLLDGTVILSDDAGQFNVHRHALCWVHAERLIHKINTFNDEQRHAVEHVRALIWWYYADLKAYCRDPTSQARARLKPRFNRIFRRSTGFATLDNALARIHANKEALLVVLDRPEVPLNTNGSENDIRCHVTRRKISGGTHSETGRQARDTFLGLYKTCRKLGISFWQYLGDRLSVPNAPSIAYLPDIIAETAS